MHRSVTNGRQSLEICAQYLIDFVLVKAVAESLRLKLLAELLITTAKWQPGRGRIPLSARQSRLNV